MRAQNEARRRRNLRLRIWLVLAGFGLFCLILVGRSVDLQVLRQDRLEALAQKEFMRRAKISPRRGIIYDRNHEELAVSLDTDSVYAQPVAIKTPEETGRALARSLGLKPAEVIKSLKSEKRFVWVARRIDPQQAMAVTSLKLKGVGLVQEPRRFYPYSELASHVLGFAGLDEKGRGGLEAFHNTTLLGKAHQMTWMRDANGRTIHLTKAAFTQLPEGNHLILTLDKKIQYHTEKALKAAVKKHRAKRGHAVVMNPRTGEILAMANVPDFNPNVYSRYREQTWRNRSITDPFEPGSTFKVFVAAAALASKKISLHQKIYCENGSWSVGRRTIHDTHPYKMLNLAGIIKYSSNIGIAKVGRILGAKSLYETFTSFGFGQKSDVDLPAESKGQLRDYENWRPVELANMCFGQGISVTCLQLLNAFCAIANGGVLMQPYVVKSVLDKDARILADHKPRVIRRAMDEAAARILTGMMVKVTEEGGTGTNAAIAGIKVAGKTGTAQKVKGGGYSHTDYMSSFAGFAPADDPKVAVLVTLDTPRKGGHYGGTVSAPAFREITSYALKQLHGYHMPEPEHLAGADKTKNPAQSPQAPAADISPVESLALGLTPDFQGLTLRQVLRLADEGPLSVSINGWGRVVHQKPRAGSPLTRHVSLLLEPKGGGV